MAGRGPAPKPNAVRRNKAPYEHDLVGETQVGRELPRALGVKSAGAKRFWRTWSTSPQAREWQETDWAELELTVVLVDAFFLGETKHASEIRLRVAKWGATTEDRARLRMTFDKSAEADEDEPANETAADLDEELFRLLNTTD
ncbi:phage terminase small subunit [Embleya hyalina]|uniref:Uncharacterized protein n=1 Tax=Embleya hyalina TaxID=516124 RepID=A0A401YZ30_9ACTN|nr:hypothetical protein [Embleya hyalina]GCD99851.1 hypothetical protein EHYA_07573 [Embleya hyalina]